IFSSSGEEISYLRKREKFNLKFINYTREISLISDVSALFATYTALKKIKPDIINAGTPKAAFLLMIAAYFMGTPVRIFTLRGLRSSTLKGIKKRIVVFTEKVTCNLATEVIVISPSLKKEA